MHHSISYKIIGYNWVSICLELFHSSPYIDISPVNIFFLRVTHEQSLAEVSTYYFIVNALFIPSIYQPLVFRHKTLLVGRKHSAILGSLTEWTTCSNLCQAYLKSET
jgi:hypothetical protein